MLPRLPLGLLTIALMAIAMLAIISPTWAQSCAITPTLPAPQSAPVSNLPAARPPSSTSLPAAQAAPDGNLNLVNGLVSYWKFDDASEVATLYHGRNGNPFGNSSCGFSY